MGVQSPSTLVMVAQMSLGFYTVWDLQWTVSPDVAHALKQHLPPRVDTDNNMTLHVAKATQIHAESITGGQAKGRYSPFRG